MFSWYISYAFNGETGLKVDYAILHLDCEFMNEDNMLETIATIEDEHLPVWAIDSQVTILSAIRLSCSANR